jgi:hypothetical protein
MTSGFNFCNLDIKIKENLKVFDITVIFDSEMNVKPNVSPNVSPSEECCCNFSPEVQIYTQNINNFSPNANGEIFELEVLESNNSPDFCSEIISYNHIEKACSYIVQICCINLNYSTFNPSSHGCCKFCFPFLSRAQYYVDKKLDDIKNIQSGDSIDSQLPFSKKIIQLELSLPQIVTNMLLILQRKMRFRITELIQGLIFFEQIIKVCLFNWLLFFFYLIDSLDVLYIHPSSSIIASFASYMFSGSS